MGAESLESIPVFSMRPQAIQGEVPALQFDLRSTLCGFSEAGHLLRAPTRMVTSALLDFPLDSTARAARV